MDQKADHDTHNNDVVAEAIAAKEKAESLRATAIQQLLKQQEQVLANLRALGYTPTNGNGTGHAKDTPGAGRQPSAKRFKDMKLAEIAKVLLTEHNALHGTKIEELAKAGGYTGGTANFQNYLPVALKRDGGFENTGGNTWRLKNGST
jgi:hypothetical protein